MIQYQDLIHENFKSGTVMRWFQMLNIIDKQFPREKLSRFMECFWGSQISSKLWLLKTLKDHHLLGHLSHVPTYVYGGWYGILAQMLFDETQSMIISVDIDPDCETYGQYFAPDVMFMTEDMTKHKAPPGGAVAINTSSEHITQEQYDTWIGNRERGSLVIVQGNDYFSNPEHVRCHTTLEEFVQSSGINTVVYSGSLDCNEFTRFMIIGFV